MVKADPEKQEKLRASILQNIENASQTQQLTHTSPLKTKRVKHVL